MPHRPPILHPSVCPWSGIGFCSQWQQCHWNCHGHAHEEKCTRRYVKSDVLNDHILGSFLYFTFSLINGNRIQTHELTTLDCKLNKLPKSHYFWGTSLFFVFLEHALSSPKLFNFHLKWGSQLFTKCTNPEHKKGKKNLWIPVSPFIFNFAKPETSMISTNARRLLKTKLLV